MISELISEPKKPTGFGLSGVPVDNVPMREALHRIEQMIEEGGMHQVATANVDFLVHAKRDAEYSRILCMCDMVVADGMPIVWASGLFGTQLSERVAGADLVPQLVDLSARKGYSIFLLGGTREVVDAAARQMEKTSPGVRIAGKLSPPVRPLDEFDDASILAEIARAKPDILLVAFGSPKQEKWISRNRRNLKVPVCIGVGGTLDFLAGAVQRAPVWMQKSGLEWLFRMCVEPSRLVPRYFTDGLWMARYLFVQLAVQQSFRLRQQDLEITQNSVGSINVVGVKGALTGPKLDKLAKVLGLTVRSGRPMILDLSATSHVGADGLWELAGLLKRSKQGNCEVWLAGLSSSLERQLRAAHFGGLFQIAPSVVDAAEQISARQAVLRSQDSLWEQVAGAA